jgi:hypothetical protein
LDIHVKETLVLVRQESAWKRFAKPPGDERHYSQHNQTHGGFPNQGAANANVAIIQAFIPAVEFAKEPSQGAFALLLWAEQQGGKRGAQA